MQARLQSKSDSYFAGGVSFTACAAIGLCVCNRAVFVNRVPLPLPLLLLLLHSVVGHTDANNKHITCVQGRDRWQKMGTGRHGGIGYVPRFIISFRISIRSTCSKTRMI